MDLTLHDLSPEFQQALVLRAATENKSLEEALADAAARDLGVASTTKSPSAHQANSRESSYAGCAECHELDTSKTTYTTNEYGAIIVRPATTDADGNPLPKRRDLSFLMDGPPLEPEVLEALEAQRQIDPELWQ